jgi:hypothetical protein
MLRVGFRLVSYSPRGEVDWCLSDPRVAGSSCLCGLRTSVKSFPLYVAFPRVSVLRLIRLPIHIRRASPFTVLLRLPVPLSTPPLRFPPNPVSGFPLACLNSGIPYLGASHDQERMGPPKFFDVSLASHPTACGLRRTSTPSPFRASRIGFGFVKTLAIRNKLISKLCQHKRRARSPLRPTGFSVYASPVLFASPSAPPQTQDSIRVGG